MAKAHVAMRVGFALVVGVAVLALVGCQQSKSTAAQKLPTPSLDGPVVKNAAPIAKAAPPATRPINPAPAMAAAQKSRGERGGVSQEWLINGPANSCQYIVIHHRATPA